jgi:tetratricopeptide (TPR) repeat protein
VREEKKAKILAGSSHGQPQTSARSWEKAARALEQALELAPEDPGLTELLRATRASQRADRLQSLPEKARSLAASERWDEASAAWQEYLSLEPSDPELAQAEIERLKEAQGLAQTYAEAQAALSRKDYDQAISILKGIVARDETYKESTRLLLQAIEARRRASPKFRIKWKGVRLSRKARRHRRPGSRRPRRGDLRRLGSVHRAPGPRPRHSRTPCGVRRQGLPAHRGRRNRRCLLRTDLERD